MKIFVNHRLFCLPLLLLVVGCADRRAFKTPDAWFNPPPLMDPRQNEVLDGSRINLVAPLKELQAEEMLMDKPFIALTDAKAEELVGLPLRVGSGSRPYLIRAVYLIRNTGVFQVFRLPAGDIYVLHECLGNHTAIMHRQALVVQLDEAPKRVFIACSMNSTSASE